MASVRDVPELNRFEIEVDGALAGFAVYERDQAAKRISFVHTEVDQNFEGQGLGGELVSAALVSAREAQLAVLPFCPFVRGFIDGHRDEYLDLVPADLREGFGLGDG